MRAFGIGQLEEAVGRASELEGVAGLQALAFQPDSGTRDLAFDERRTLDQSRDALGRGDDIISGDQFSFC